MRLALITRTNRSDRKPRRAQVQCTLTGLHTTRRTAYGATLLAPMCRTSIGRRFRENKAGRSSYCRMLTVQYYVIFDQHVRIYVGTCCQNAIFSAYWESR